MSPQPATRPWITLPPMRDLPRSGATLVLVLVALLLGVAADARADRYSAAGGCFDVHVGGDALAADPLRFRATRLGEYLLYGTAEDHVALGADGRVVRVAEPSPAAEWRLGADGTLTNVGSGRSLGVATLSPATGCAVLPEARPNVTGPLPAATAPTGEVSGTVDTHGHIAAFEIFGGDWHCGTPWHPYGPAYALPDCTTKRRGTNGTLADTLEGGMTPRPGWPTFPGWPRPSAVASEGMYWTSLQRAWRSGLRVMVALAVENEPLCSVMTQRRRPCDDMASARAQLRALHELQDYVDAQMGGPGKGFLRIVRDPLAARRAIARGQVAVVLGIEVSRLFGCGQHADVPECDRADVDAGMRQLRDLDVSSVFPVHKFDNAFGGTKMDPGEQGLIVQAGNVHATGAPWSVETCTGPERDNDISTSPQVPTPHCNTRGLTDLGAYLVDRLADAGVLVELDHMSVKTSHAVMDRLEARGYAGVVSSHQTESQLSAALMPRILRLGGFLSPTANPAPVDYLDRWKQALAARDPRFVFGIGYGSDMNGLAAQSRPGSETGDPLDYPFRALDGRTTLDREQWGERTFDITQDGLATYGMYADWLEQVRRRGGDGVARDLLRGAEAYLQTWERARGVPVPSCRPARERLTGLGLGGLRLGATAEAVLRRAGQPTSRPGRAYRWCVAGASGTARPVRVVFGDDGRVALVASTASRHATAGGLRAGRRVRGRPGVRVGPRLRRGARIVHAVRGGRVRWVAAADAATARSPARLRAALRAAGLR